jgi:endoglucanase
MCQMKWNPYNLIRGNGLSAFLVIGVSMFTIQAAPYNYAEALQKSIYFYECQQSGPLPSWNRVQWRGPACVHDGRDVGKDLSGGWFDAGDHVKFNFPMAATVTMLCWGVKEYRDTYEKSGQLTAILNNIRFAAEYLIKCHTAPDEFYGQVGQGDPDHKFWGPAESVEAHMARPSAKIDKTHPGSDLAGEAAAALAAASIVLKSTDAAFSAICLSHARELYAFADSYRGMYHLAITDVTNFYKSWSGFEDELVWAAIWLHLATNEKAYLDKAEGMYTTLPLENQMTVKKYKWTQNWDCKSYGCYALLAMITDKQQYHTDAQRWLDWWTVGVDDAKVKYTPGGLAWLDSWGSNRYSANTALVAFIYSDNLTDAALKKRYHDFAVGQINYMLGDNPVKRSFLVGFGANPPVRYHHRTAHGIYPSRDSDTNPCRHVLYGALVGGPGPSDDYKDERNNYTNNEVACDYNAAFTGCLARMYQEFGGTPLAGFPGRETPDGQYAIAAVENITGTRFSEIKAIVQNKTYCPSRVCIGLSYRYFIDISEALDAGFTARDISLDAGYMVGKPKVSTLMPFKGSSTVHYFEVTYDNDTLYPGTQDSYKREIQFRLELPASATDGDWNPKNDWSFGTVAQYGKDPMIATHFPLYDNGIQIWGIDPDGLAVKPGRSVPRAADAIFFKVQRAGGTWEISGLSYDRVTRLRVYTMTGRQVMHCQGTDIKRVSVPIIGSGQTFCEAETGEGKRFRVKVVEAE